jgi:hypothetical protein
MSHHSDSSPIDDGDEKQASVQSGAGEAIEVTMEIDVDDLILDVDPDDLLPEDDSHLERAIDGTPGFEPTGESLDEDDDLEDDDFLEQIALGTPTEPEPAPADLVVEEPVAISEPTPPKHEVALPLDPETFEKEIEALAPIRVLERRIKPIRLYTSVPAEPIPDPEFPLT